MPTIHQILKKQAFTSNEKKFLTENYLKGSKYCSKILNRSIKSIHSKCFRMGLKFTKKQLHDFKTRPRYKKNEYYAVNPDIFINPCTPKACYILGLLWADGCINIIKNNQFTVSLTTTYPDSNHFEKVFLDTGKWRVYKTKRNPNWKLSVNIVTNNRPLVEFLNRMSYKSKSESADLILSKIPKHLHHYWFRGFFDGDGCITVNKAGSWRICLSGPYEQDWSYIKKLFYMLNIKFIVKQKISNKGHRSSVVNICKKSDIIAFTEYIYQNANIDNLALPRKYQKYKKMKSLL